MFKNNTEKIKEKSFRTTLKNDGFTIVELLVVIVIIAILAAISTVAYNGVQTRAIKSSLSQSLSSLTKRLEADKVIHGAYPSSIDTIESSTSTETDSIDYQYTSTESEFCLTAIHGQIAMHITSSQRTPAEGVCSGHDEPLSGPVVDPVVHTQTGSFDTRQPTAGGGVDVPITIEYDLKPSDYVFILYNAGYRTSMKLTAPNGENIPHIYSKSMGASGYQKHLAYGISGLTGPQTIEANACWSVQCYEYSSTVEAGYIVYVIRGLGSSPSVTATSTGYGVNPPKGSLFGPSSQSLTGGKLAIFSYVYYGSRSPGFEDNSIPELTWKIDATSANTARDQVAARHAYTASSSEVKYSMVTPSDGNARYSGAVLFTFK